MEVLKSIRDLYLPVQPTVKQTGDKVVYREMVPSEQLCPFIYCYWQLKTISSLDENFTYRVVADGCIDIFFELKRSQESFVMGFCKKYTEFPLEAEFHYIGIRFLPTMFPQLFGVDASELSNRYENLNLVHKRTQQFLSQSMNQELSFQEIKERLDVYFLKHLAVVNWNLDSRLYAAVNQVLKTQGILSVQNDLDVGLSERQLRRLFNYYIGDSVKTFSKVVRFQNMLRAKPSVQSLKRNKLFFDSGYYDQAHFIKEFKNHYGVTPSKAFGR